MGYKLGEYIGIENIQSYSKGYFFNQGTMRSFGTDLSNSVVVPVSDGWLFNVLNRKAPKGSRYQVAKMFEDGRTIHIKNFATRYESLDFMRDST